MRATRIDFVAPAARTSRPGAALFVAGALLAGAAVFYDASRGEELARTQEQLEKARAAYRRAAAAHAPNPGRELADFKPFGDIERRLDAPWGDLLDALEQADSEHVALLTVEPDAERGRLRLSGEAKDLDALVGYVKALDGRAGIAGLRVMTQQVKPNDAQRPVEFVLESNWLRKARGAAADGASS